MLNKLTNIEIEKIIKSKRKTIALQITDNATLIIKAPFDISNETLNQILLKHIKWIEKKKREIEARVVKFKSKKFVSGEEFLFLGRYYKLKIVDNQDIPLKFDNIYFYISRRVLPDAKEHFIKWYKKKAYEKISERVTLHAQEGKFKYNKIKISNAEKRWGSCSYRGNLNFSWRLIMAPLSVVDYVVAHELVHLKVKNHSKYFWDEVKILIPDYKKHISWLKLNAYLLKL
jgi:predicted metal-dependent hydrolase